MSPLRRAADTAIIECLSMKASERLLIVSNPGTEQEAIAKALEAAATFKGIGTTL